MGDEPLGRDSEPERHQFPAAGSMDPFELWVPPFTRAWPGLACQGDHVCKSPGQDQLPATQAHVIFRSALAL
eukprot:12626444-Alexandrium_andersonii.AAC.1